MVHPAEKGWVSSGFIGFCGVFLGDPGLVALDEQFRAAIRESNGRSVESVLRSNGHCYFTIRHF
jgi:hypothetical protein